MKDDAQKALEELDAKLRADMQPEDDDLLLEEIINEVHSLEPDDLTEEPEGAEEEAEEETEAEEPAVDEKKAKEDRIQTVLMFVASGLSLGISGLLIYWLVNYL